MPPVALRLITELSVLFNDGCNSGMLDMDRPQQIDEVRNAFNVQLVAVKRTRMPEVDEQSISEKPGT